ncbi:hypothetical protein [Mucilaginibacter sp. UYCu711]|uniref:hypothetical protein n=1 Tax=Mucilaginibacter sp. UYCu711 TaxID=3156339 RepID=UPI003D1AFD74
MGLSKRPSPLKVVLIGFGLYILVEFIMVIIPAIRNGFDSSHTPLPEHTTLLTYSVQSKLPQAFVYKSKIQGAQSNYVFADGFHFTIYQVALKINQPLSRILKLNDKEPNRTYEVFSPYQESEFLKMTKSTSAVDSVSAVYFRYNGQLIKSFVQNDSLAYYHLKYNKFSISYDDAGNDVWSIAKQSYQPSISVAFIKKEKTLYVVMLYRTENENLDFPADKLYNMLKK